MTWTVWRRVAVSALVLVVAGCGALDVSDPTAIEDGELNDAAGAQLLRGGALRQYNRALGNGAYMSGVMSDEFLADPPAWYAQYGIVSDAELMDRRDNLGYEQLNSGAYAGYRYGSLQEARRTATLAMPKLAAYGTQAQVGEMLALRGLATVGLAENLCPGFPLHELAGFALVYGSPQTTVEAFERALADFDTAITFAADSERVLNFARVGRARALLGLGRFAEAATTVAAVPIDFSVNAQYVDGGADNMNPLVVISPGSQSIWSMADREGGTGLDFVSAEDPRLPTDSAGIANDGVTYLFGPSKYRTRAAPIVVASGTEAWLIRAEADWAAGGTQWLGLLNELRARVGLSDTTAPASSDAQLDLIFRERAFWLYGTAHRLGDLRRLVAYHDRDAESVFPSGVYRLGGAYSAATTLPFPASTESSFNPAVTGCTSR